MRKIGDRPNDGLRFGRDFIELGLDAGGLLADAAAFLLEGLALFRRGLADGPGSFVGLAIGLVGLGLQAAPLVLKFDEPIDVGSRVAILAVPFDEIDVVDDEFAVEHGSTRGFGENERPHYNKPRDLRPPTAR